VTSPARTGSLEGRCARRRIARQAGLTGPRASAALISADEVAVARFLRGGLDFNGISRVLALAVDKFGSVAGGDPSLEELVALDAEVRSFAEVAR
jgi:1-deoxy-D-xylulose 5-phosphate reductoisomerase